MGKIILCDVENKYSEAMASQTGMHIDRTNRGQLAAVQNRFPNSEHTSYTDRFNGVLYSAMDR